MDKNIKGIIFDLGGVLINLRTRKFLSEISRILKIDNTEHFKNIFVNEAERIDSARESGMDFWRELCEKLGTDFIDDKKLLSIWPKWVGGVNKKVETLVKELRGNHPLALLSNFVLEHTELIKGLGIYKYFDAVILSTEVGLKKPDRRIYKLAAERLKIPPENLVFIDDKIENVEGAERCGMHGILFENIRQLRKELNGLGVC